MSVTNFDISINAMHSSSFDFYFLCSIAINIMKLKTACTLECEIGGHLRSYSPIVVTNIWLWNKLSLILFEGRTVLCMDKKNRKLLLFKPLTGNVWQHLMELEVHTCFDSDTHL